MQSCATGLKFEYRVESSADTLRVYLRGHLVHETLDATAACWRVLRARARPNVVLDLSEVKLLASAPLGALVGLRRWLLSRGYRLQISAMSAEVREIMERTRLNRLFSIVEETCDSAALDSTAPRFYSGQVVDVFINGGKW